MTYEELLASMTPEIHAAMKLAIEIGKWPNGVRLSDDEREACMQAVIGYDLENVPADERVGFIDRTKKDGTQHSPSQSTEDIIKILHS